MLIHRPSTAVRGVTSTSLLALVAATAFAAPPTPPPTPKHPTTDTYHGTPVVDDYRWLEDAGNPDVKAWSDAQNAVARAYLDGLPNAAAIRARVDQIMTAPSIRYVGLKMAGSKLLALRREPSKQQPVLVAFDDVTALLKAPRADVADPPPVARVVLDPEVIDPSHHTTIDWFIPSPDGKLLAVSLSSSGTESGDVHVYTLADGKQVHEVVPRVNGGTAGGSLAWAPDSAGFYYTRYPRAGERPAEDMDFFMQVYFHKLGTDTKSDKYEMGKDLPRIAEIVLESHESKSAANGAILASVQKGDGGEFIHFLRDPASGMWTQFTQYEDRVVQATFGAPGDDAVYLVSRKNAPRGQLLRLALSSGSAGASRSAGMDTAALADLGRDLHAKKGCALCHSVTGAPSIGPSWKGWYAKTGIEYEDGAKRPAPGPELDQWIRDNFLNSQRHIVKGYPKSMPTYGATLKNSEIEGLLAFIKSLSPETPAPAQAGKPGDAQAPALADAKVIVPETTDTLVSEFADAANLVVTDSLVYAIYQLGGPSEVRVFTHDGQPAAKPTQPPVAAAGGLVRMGADAVLFNLTSYIQPSTWMAFNPADLSAQPLARIAALSTTSPADFSAYEVVREMATSKDGTKVPVNIIRKKGLALDGSHPAVVSGYGGYGVNIEPGFNPADIVRLEQGFVLAEVNLRGGGEFGEAWHRAGNLENKQNVFDDFAAACKLMIDRKYTTPQKLAIEGGSNGGLLMGAALTQHPDMFKAVVSHVGIYDMLRVELSPNGAFNVPEFGTVKDAKLFNAMYAYSPYHNVKDGTPYPATLFLTGANDPRVDPMQSRKMTARLQSAIANVPSAGPILLRTSGDTGHGMGTPLKERIAQNADVDAFMFQQLGVEYKPVGK